jgi:hypothetical protein
MQERERGNQEKKKEKEGNIIYTVGMRAVLQWAM